MSNNKTLVLGIGNPILSNDSVGIRFARKIKKRVFRVNIKEAGISGFSILDEIGSQRSKPTHHPDYQAKFS